MTRLGVSVGGSHGGVPGGGSPPIANDPLALSSVASFGSARDTPPPHRGGGSGWGGRRCLRSVRRSCGLAPWPPSRAISACRCRSCAGSMLPRLRSVSKCSTAFDSRSSMSVSQRSVTLPGFRSMKSSAKAFSRPGSETETPFSTSSILAARSLSASVKNEPAGDRTQDLRIKSPLLYQLSYRLVVLHL